MTLQVGTNAEHDTISIPTKMPDLTYLSVSSRKINDYWNIVTTLTGLKELIIPGTSSPFGGGPTVAEKDVLSLLCLTNLTSLVIHGAEAEWMSHFTHIDKIGPVLL